MLIKPYKRGRCDERKELKDFKKTIKKGDKKIKIFIFLSLGTDKPSKGGRGDEKTKK